MVSRTTYRLGALAVLAVGIAVRTGSLHASPLPFNPDGIVYSGHVRIAVGTGELPLSRMPTDDYQFTGLLVAASALTGVDSLAVGQPVAAVVGATTGVLAIPVARRLTGRWLPGDRARSAALLAGGLVAVEGLYLHRSAATDEQTLGLLLVPTAVVALALAPRLRSSWGGVALVGLAALPPTHNLDSVVAGLALSLWAAAGLTDRGGIRPRVRVALLAGFWAHFVGYNLAVERLTASAIIQTRYLSTAPGVLVAWLIAAATALALARGASDRRLRLLVGGLVAVPFGLVAVNAVGAIFPGLPATDPTLLALLAPLALPCIAAAWAVPLGRGKRLPRGLAALAGAVAVLLGFGLTASLTPEYLNLLYRAQTFLHFPALVAAAAGVAVGLRRSSRSARAVAAAAVLVAAAASVPVAFAGLELLPYKGTTTPAELRASGFALAHAPGPVGTDDHLSRISGYYRHEGEASFRSRPGAGRFVTAPVYGWAVGGEPPPCGVLVRDSWATVGAQFYPEPTVTVSESRLRTLTERRHVVYAGGGASPIAYATPTESDSDGQGC